MRMEERGLDLENIPVSQNCVGERTVQATKVSEGYGMRPRDGGVHRLGIRKVGIRKMGIRKALGHRHNSVRWDLPCDAGKFLLTETPPWTTCFRKVLQITNPGWGEGCTLRKDFPSPSPTGTLSSKGPHKTCN